MFCSQAICLVFLILVSGLKLYLLKLIENYFKGIFLRDLTFVDDSLDNTLDNGFANFHKMKKMSSIMQSILHYQSSKFSFPVHGQLYNYLKNVTPLSEETLYDKSTKCEAPSDLWNI